MSQPVPTLDRLEKIDPRAVWLSESDDFTPWLADYEKFKLMGNTIGLALECVNHMLDTRPSIEAGTYAPRDPRLDA